MRSTKHIPVPRPVLLGRGTANAGREKRPPGLRVLPVGAATPLIPILVMMIAVLGAFALFEADHYQLVASAVFGILACAAVHYDLVSRGISASYCAGYMIASALVGKFVLLILGMTGITSGGNGAQFSLMAKPWLMILYMNFSLLAIWLLTRLLYRRRDAKILAASFVAQIEGDRICFEWLTVVGIPLVFGETIGPFLPGILRYPLDVAGAAMSFMPFFVGRFVRRTTMAFWLWVAALGINGLIMVMMGGRYAALFPLLVFCIGVASSLPRRRKYLLLTLLLLGSVPGLSVVGMLGIIRDELGRDTTANVSRTHFQNMVAYSSQLDLSRDVFARGLGRLVPWANYAPVVLTPEVIPYRGLDTFPAEAVNSASVYALSPKAAVNRVALKMGTMPANDYGYLVNEQTSVEWGTIADGWSRAGWLGAILFLLFAYGVGLMIEQWFMTSTAFRPAVKIIFISFLMGRLLRSGSTPLLDYLRGVAVYLLILVVALKLLNHVLNLVFPRSAAAAPRLAKANPA